MRHGRAKASRRTLQFYRLNAPHLKPVYKVLLDGTFLVAAIRNKVPLHDRFAKILQNEDFKLYISRSTLVELATLSKKYASRAAAAAAVDAKDDSGSNSINFFLRARQFGLDECEIIEDDDSRVVDDNITPDDDDIKKNSKKVHVVGSSSDSDDFSGASKDIFQLATKGGNNSHAYFVATQDDALADALRAKPYVPIFRLGRAVLLLESPSSASRSATGTVEQGKLTSAGGTITAEERRLINTVKKKEQLKKRETMKEEQKILEKRSRDEYGGAFSMRKKKRAKGPNPLSCKSKK